MKALKIFGIVISSLIVIAYMTFLFVLPNAINLNQFKPNINSIVKSLADLDFNSKDIKMKTTWNFKLNLIFNDVSIKYPNKKELISTKQATIGVNLIPLIRSKIELSSIKLTTPKLNINFEKDNRYDLEKYISNILGKNYANQQNKTESETNLKLSDNMPDIILENYIITLNDQKTQDNIKINGKEFKIYEFKLNHKIKINTAGELLLNDKNCVNYKAQIDSFLPKTTNSQTNQPINIPQFNYNPIPVIKNYNFKADIDTNLKISSKDNDILIKGYFNTTNLNYKIQSQNLNQNFIKLAFNGNKIDIKSDLYVDAKEKFIIDGVFKTGKNQNIDLKIISDKIDLVDIQRVLIAITDIANIKTDISKLRVSGFLDSNFNIKSDFKKIQSQGHLKIANASIKHTDLPLVINSIKSDLDFNNNNISINNTSALINNSLFKATGDIDNKANANIKITADKLPLSLLYNAFSPEFIKKTLKINDGALTINALINGKLNKIEPKINLALENFKLYETNSNTKFALASANIDLKANTKGEYDGLAKLKTANLNIANPKTNLTTPSIELDFDTKNIKLKPFSTSLDNSKFTIDGTIKDYTSKLNAQFNLNGNLVATDIKKYIPKEYHPYITAKGSLPIKASIKTDGQNTQINAQALANAQNHLAILNINSLKNNSSITNLDIETNGNIIKIKDIGLYGLNQNISLGDNLSKNLNSTTKLVSLDGKISNITQKNPTLQNIKFTTPNIINASIPGMQKSSLSFKTDLNISGTTSTPIIKGTVSIPNLSIDDFKISSKNTTLNFNKETIAAKSQLLNLNGSTISFDSLISTNFNKYTTIKTLNINSEYVDIDKLIQIIELVPQTSVTPSASVPIIIEKGHGNITKIKSGNIIATNASSDFTLKNNLFKLNSINANAYTGVIAGNAEYNIPYETTKVNIQGRGLDSNSALMILSGLKDQMNGKLDFDADLTMIGMNYEQQLKTLKGQVNFSVNDGQMGSLGRLEHFIYASNLLSQKFSQSTLNSVAQTLAPKNTGKFKYLKGHLTFSNGWAKLDPIHSGGPQMSLYITGNYNLLNNYANIEILGRITKEIANVLGPLGDISISKILGKITSFGQNATTILNSYNIAKDAATIAKVPQLVPASTDTKEFQVIINGNVEKPTSVRSFKWLASQEELNSAKTQINTQIQQLIPQKIQDFIKPTTQSNITPSTTSTSTQQSISETLKDAAKDAATNQIKKVLPSFWDKIE